jgi:hypothetical protein
MSNIRRRKNVTQVVESVPVPTITGVQRDDSRQRIESGSDSGVDNGGRYGYDPNNSDDDTSSTASNAPENDTGEISTEGSDQEVMPAVVTLVSAGRPQLQGVERFQRDPDEDFEDYLILGAGVVGFILCLMCGGILPFVGVSEVSTVHFLIHMTLL